MSQQSLTRELVPRSALNFVLALVGALVLILLLAASTRISFALPFVLVAFAVLLAYAVHNLRFGIAATISAVLLVPLQLGIHVGPSSVSIGRAIEFAFLGGWAGALCRRDGPIWRRSPLGVAMVAFLLGWGLSLALNGPHLDGGLFGDGIRRLLVFAIDYFLFFYAVLSVFTISRRHVLWVLRIIAGTVVVVSFLAMVEKVTGRDVFTFISPALPHNARAYLNALASAARLNRGLIVRVRSTLAGPNQLGAVCTMTLPLIVYFAGRARGYARIGWVIGGITTVLAAIFTGSRSAIICLVLVVLVQLFAGGRGSTVRRGSIAIAVTIAVVFAVSSPVRSTFALYFHALQGKHDTSVQSRATQAGVVMEQFRQHPIAGYGPGSFAAEELRKRVRLDPTFKTLDNSYLGTLGELGLAGEVPLLAITLGAPFLVIARLRRTRSPDERSLLAALLAGLCAFAVLAYFFDILAFYAEPRLYMVLLAAAMALTRYARPEPVREDDPSTEVSRGGVQGLLEVARGSKVPIAGAGIVGLVGGVMFAVASPRAYVAQSLVQLDRPLAVASFQDGHRAIEELVSVAPSVALTSISDPTLSHVIDVTGTKATVQQLRDDMAVVATPGQSFVTLALRQSSNSKALSVARALTDSLTSTADSMGYTVHVIEGPRITAVGGPHLKARALVGLLIGLAIGGVASLFNTAARRHREISPILIPA